MISSALPYDGKDLVVKLNALGLCGLCGADISKFEQRKALKDLKVHLNDVSEIIEWLDGNHEEQEIEIYLRKKRENIENVEKKGVVLTKIKINERGENNVYTVFPYHKVKLGFLLESSNNEIIKEVERILKDLGEIGILADKSVGNGQFTITMEDYELKEKENGQYHFLLSLYKPKKALDYSNIPKLAHWRIVQRIGRREGGGIKKPINYFSEFSLLPNHFINTNGLVEDENMNGCVYSVYRGGFGVRV